AHAKLNGVSPSSDRKFTSAPSSSSLDAEASFPSLAAIIRQRPSSRFLSKVFLDTHISNAETSSVSIRGERFAKIFDLFAIQLLVIRIHLFFIHLNAVQWP